MDGYFNEHENRANFILTIPGSDYIKLGYAFRLGFKVLNNEVEYKSLIIRLKMAKILGAPRS